MLSYNILSYTVLCCTKLRLTTEGGFAGSERQHASRMLGLRLETLGRPQRVQVALYQTLRHQGTYKSSTLGPMYTCIYMSISLSLSLSLSFSHVGVHGPSGFCMEQGASLHSPLFETAWPEAPAVGAIWKWNQGSDRQSDWTLPLRVQSTQNVGYIYGFCIGNHNQGFGSMLCIWVLGPLGFG